MNIRTKPSSINRWWQRFGEIFVDIVKHEQSDNGWCESNWICFGGRFPREMRSRLNWPEHRCVSDKWPEHWTLDNPKPVITVRLHEERTR